jgi:N-acylglucosamine-6-phosphate 2-epimerase
VVQHLKNQFPDVAVMADCATAVDAQAAEAAGVDILGTTLAGYTPQRPKTDGPDLALIEEITHSYRLHVIAEGRIHIPQQAASALHVGAYAVCVGTAITHPTTLTGWFSDALDAVVQRGEKVICRDRH